MVPRELTFNQVVWLVGLWLVTAEYKLDAGGKGASQKHPERKVQKGVTRGWLTALDSG